jgi:2-keto-4-pentenoate hydratase/2-oxohepta-3-ene-1,7-dioic acid hydratase in catechol pathway
LLAAVLSSAWLVRPVFDGVLDDAVFSGMTMAPPEDALTLAVSDAGAVLLVTGVDADGITAVDINAVTGQSFTDAIDARRGLGVLGLRTLYDSDRRSFYRWDALSLPVAPRYPHIAAGTNYRAHAREVGLEEEPFLFPKLSRPTAWDSGVLPGARLDYEVELCAVLLTDHSAAQPATLGYMLCGDFTDRWTLVRDLDLDGEMGRTGFPLAKGGKSRLPVGPLLLMPAEEDFYEGLELSLYLDGALRQRDFARQMVWSPREILDKALVDCESPYLSGADTVHITGCERIPAGSIILTGTPEGVLFHLGTLWNPWAYLREGNAITSLGTYLGYMRNEIRKY